MARYPKAEQSFYPDKARSFRCPADLSPEAAKFWRAIAPGLLEKGVLADIDKPAFRTLCRCYSLLEQAATEMETAGCTTLNVKTGEVKKHPSASVYKSQCDLFSRLAQQFGLTPSSRGRINCQPTAEADAINDYLNGKVSQIR